MTTTAASTSTISRPNRPRMIFRTLDIETTPRGERRKRRAQTEYRSLRPLVSEPLRGDGLELRGRQRPADDKALRRIAAGLVQEFQRLPGFHRLGRGGKAEFARQRDDAPHQVARVLVLGQLVDQPPVDLQLAERRPVQLRARGNAASVMLQ